MKTLQEYSLKNIPARIMKVFEKCAEKAKNSMMKSQHCACIEKGGQIFSYMVNDYTNVSISKINKFSYHAEEALLKKLAKMNKGRTKYNLYIVRINHNGKIVNSMPCENCTRIIKKYASLVSKVIYPTEESVIVIRPLDIISTHCSIGNKVRKSKHKKKCCIH